MDSKFLYEPVNPFKVGQRFGQNLACIDNTTGKVFSKNRSDTPCPPNSRSVYGPGGHSGIDVAAKRWQPVYAAHDGEVIEVSTEEARGLGIGLVTKEKYYSNETGSMELWKSRYWHLIALNVHMGETVRAGDLLGYADSTGMSSGDHLHFEVKIVRKDENGTYYNVLQNNETYGAVDPLPHMLPIFAVHISTLRAALEKLSILLDQLSDWVRGTKSA